MMRSAAAVLTFLQSPLAPPPGPVPLHPGLFNAMTPHTLEAVGATAGAVVLALVLWRMRAAKVRSEAGPAPVLREQEVLPPPQYRVELPPSAEEAARVEEAAQAQSRAEALAVERRQLSYRLKDLSSAAERADAEARIRDLKAREEVAKREQYHASKAAEREAKERRLREALASKRLADEAAEEARRTEDAQRQEAEVAARARVQAEAGQTLAQGLDKTRNQGFMARLNTLLAGQKALDESVLVELEEVLFTADIGVRTASRLVEVARERLQRKELADLDKVKALIRSEIEKILELPTPRSLEGGGPPHVTMVVGVNGAGKTTTIGKLAARLTGEGKRVVLAAGDTFRAAAAEQLDVWAGRAQAELVKGTEGADPSSVIFDGLKRAMETGADVVLADTAGRLHTKAPLMEELKKVRRVMDKALPGAPHEVLLVLDATNGQNAIAQAKQFHEAVQVTAIALTKLDGTAKGGVIIGICDELKIPVAWVGIGEKVSDLRRFDPREFVAALFD